MRPNEVEPELTVSPLYCAVTLSEPAESIPVVHAATPPVNVTLPQPGIGVLLLNNVAVPVGVPVPETVAVKVTDWLRSLGLIDEVRSVVEAFTALATGAAKQKTRVRANSVAKRARRFMGGLPSEMAAHVLHKGLEMSTIN